MARQVCGLKTNFMFQNSSFVARMAGFRVHKTRFGFLVSQFCCLELNFSLVRQSQDSGVQKILNSSHLKIYKYVTRMNANQLDASSVVFCV